MLFEKSAGSLVIFFAIQVTGIDTAFIKRKGSGHSLLFSFCCRRVGTLQGPPRQDVAVDPDSNPRPQHRAAARLAGVDCGGAELHACALAEPSPLSVDGVDRSHADANERWS